MGVRIVLCDDDALLRRVIGGLRAFAPHDVVGETSSALEAVELVEREQAEVCVLDLSLALGNGKDVLDELRRRDLPCEVIVFTAFVAEEAALRAAGATAVVEKPDFHGLEVALTQIVERRPAHVAVEDALEKAPVRRERRRSRSRAGELPERSALSPSGLEPPIAFSEAVAAANVGDTTMALGLDDLVGLERVGGGLIAADHRLALARLLGRCLRAGDRVSVSEDGELLVLLVASQEEAAERAFRRIDDAWQAIEGLGTLRAGAARRADGEAAPVTIARAVGALAHSRAERAERLVWS